MSEVALKRPDAHGRVLDGERRVVEQRVTREAVPPREQLQLAIRQILKSALAPAICSLSSAAETLPRARS